MDILKNITKVEQGIILEFSSTWWHMCDVAYNAHAKENYPY